MTVLVRILLGVALLSLGFYIGREIGRAESVRKELDRLDERHQVRGLQPKQSE